MTQILPLARLLTPSFSEAVPIGFTLAASDVANGLPHRIELSAELTLKLTVPTGLARQWLELDSGAIVSSSIDQAKEFDQTRTDGIAGRQTPRLCVIQNNGIIGCAPLTLGRFVRFSGNGASVRIELIVLGWSLSAASVRGTVSDGSFLRLAWRAAHQPVSEFGPPPLSSYVVRRIEPAQRAESQLYRHDTLQYRGHLANSVVRKARP